MYKAGAGKELFSFYEKKYYDKKIKNKKFSGRNRLKLR